MEKIFRKGSMMTDFERAKKQYLEDFEKREGESKPTKEHESEIAKQNESKSSLEFGWWNIWAWLGLIIGNLYCISVFNVSIMGILLVILNTSLCIGILRYSKFSFLIATILTFNPLIWIINGIYLKNRWSHPKLNKGKRYK